MGRFGTGERTTVIIKINTKLWKKYQDQKKSIGIIPAVQIEKDIDKMLEGKNGK